MKAAATAAGRREAARRSARRRVRRQRLGAGVVVAAVGVGAVALALADDDRQPTADVRRAAPARPRPPVAALPALAAGGSSPAPLALSVRRAGTLPEPLASGVAVVSGGGALVAGGLGADDTSRGAVIRVASGGPARVALRLPTALHDLAAAAIGDTAYVFGGGDGSAQHAGILALRGATAASVGSLPTASSDSAAATVGGTAYIVGGYDGTRWLDSIVAWRPGRAARVVARTPSPLRYAAVAAVGTRLLVAGGVRPDGSTTNAVLAFDPAQRAVRVLARLPGALSHAAATASDGVVLVIGGRGADGAPRRAILAVDPRSGAVRRVGTLPVALEDPMAVTTRGGVLVIGGRGPAGRVASVERLVPRAAAGATPAPPAAGNVYAADRAGLLTGAARHARALVYVPSGEANTVTVIDQRTFRVVGHYAAGGLPQHITPSYDLRTLWVSNNRGNSLQAFDPRTGRPRGAPVAVDDPYNLYFTPDGRFGIVVEERNQELAFRDPHTWRLVRSLPLPCTGVDHMDFSASGSYLLASCEFSGEVVRVDLPSLRIHPPLRLGFGARPQDVKLAPDGSVFYVADMAAGGLYLVDGARLRVRGFIRTGAGAHGLYPSRDARFLYVSNRTAGTVSVLDVATRRVVRTWTIPQGSPDMGGVSADGRTLWLSGRYSSEVYAIDTRSGRLRARIPVDAGPHGLCVWPQPGRYSLGHTGILR